MPLADYIAHPQVIAGVVLPEVITMCNVPFSLIEVSDTQPRMQNMSSFDKEDLAVAIQHNPELEVLSAYLT